MLIDTKNKGDRRQEKEDRIKKAALRWTQSKKSECGMGTD
jgi:hypothetical protein